jgi:hypothetical protein
MPDARGSIPARVHFILFSLVSRQALGPTQPPIQCVPGALYPWVKRPGSEAGHSTPDSTEIKNYGAIISHPPPYVFMI